MTNRDLRKHWLRIHAEAVRNLAAAESRAADSRRSESDREWWALYARIDRGVLAMAKKNLRQLRREAITD